MHAYRSAFEATPLSFYSRWIAYKNDLRVCLSAVYSLGRMESTRLEACKIIEMAKACKTAREEEELLEFEWDVKIKSWCYRARKFGVKFAPGGVNHKNYALSDRNARVFGLADEEEFRRYIRCFGTNVPLILDWALTHRGQYCIAVIARTEAH